MVHNLTVLGILDTLSASVTCKYVNNGRHRKRCPTNRSAIHQHTSVISWLPCVQYGNSLDVTEWLYWRHRLLLSPLIRNFRGVTSQGQSPFHPAESLSPFCRSRGQPPSVGYQLRSEFLQLYCRFRFLEGTSLAVPIVSVIKAAIQRMTTSTR